MSRLPPIAQSAATDKVAQTYERLREMFEGQPIPGPFLRYGHVPAFLQDTYMNFKKFVWSEGTLDVRSKTLVAIAVAGTLRCGEWLDVLSARANQLGLPEAQVSEALAVAASCQMYNVFFKFRELSGSELFSGMSVGLRAHTFAGTSLEAKLVELINIAVSDINGCKPCTSGHVEKARHLGVSDEAMLECIQCAATMAAACAFVNAANA
ncbi:MAG: carboxymuconolactone decarboxylase family protein [Planctomycetaceae bacterium]